jgi:endonuclease/exonuclease/phosphatase family metal-dependent hydrolase
VPLRVVSYNVHSLRDDLDALASVVRELAPDVVVVQEAPRRWRWRTKCAALAHSFGLLVAEGGLPSLGNLIMTSLRVRVHDSWSMRYPLTPGRHMRGAAFARCSVFGSVPFVVAGSHLSTDDAERPLQAALLKPALDACSDPAILAADFNETADGTSWPLLASSLVDPGGPHTFPASSPDRRIDAIFIDPRLTITSYRVFASDLTSRASDHLPVIADLTLPAAT